jgi:hypothetical protein
MTKGTKTSSNLRSFYRILWLENKPEREHLPFVQAIPHDLYRQEPCLQIIRFKEVDANGTLLVLECCELLSYGDISAVTMRKVERAYRGVSSQDFQTLQLFPTPDMERIERRLDAA